MTAIARVTHIRLKDGDVIENEDGSPLLFGVTHDDIRPSVDSSVSVSPGAVSWVQLAVHPGGRVTAEISPNAAFSHQHVAAGESPPEAEIVEGMRLNDAPLAPETRIIDGSTPGEPGQVGYDTTDGIVDDAMKPSGAFG